ncbi:MAG: hypothetical protein Q8R25_03100 [bacterium]|nr:hypothetical protein [bacterium]
MFNISFGSKQGKIIAVVDVGSGSVGCAILESHADTTATILAATRSILPLEDRTRVQTIAGIIRMLSEAGTEALRAYTESDEGKRRGRPCEVYVIIRTPWTRASAGHATRQFPEETSITKKLITELAYEAFDTNKELDRANVLETAVIRVGLNEYPTASPIGKRAHRLDLVTFESDCDPVIHKGVISTLGSLFPGRIPVLRSGARAYLTIVQEKMDHPETYVIVDMVSEATTIMAVQDGIITHHAVIEEGVRTILRRISGEKGIPEETASLLRMVVAGSCSGEACDRLNEALARVEPELAHIFGEAVAHILGKRRLPDTLVLFTHPDLMAWLTHFFSRIDFAQFTIPMHPFSVQLLSSEDLKSKSGIRVAHNVSVDTGMLMVSSFVNTQL